MTRAGGGRSPRTAPVRWVAVFSVFALAACANCEDPPAQAPTASTGNPSETPQADDPAAAESDKPMFWKIRYWTNEVDEVHPTIFEVDRAGAATLQLGTNRGDPSAIPCGLFSGSVGSARAQQLWDSVSRKEFEKMPAPTGAAPGEATRRFSISVGDSSHDKLAVESSPAPQAFVDAEQHVRAFIGELAKHPLRAFSVSVTSVKPVGDDLEVTLAVHNPGKQTITLPHPSRWEQAGASLNVHFDRKGTTPPGQEPRLFRTVAPAAVLEPAAAQGAIADITLDPGASTALRFRVPGPGEPGAFEMQAALETMLTGADPGAPLVCEALTVGHPVGQ